jgi:hypothetical protein
MRFSIAISHYLLTISTLFLVNKYAVKNFDFLKIFLSISNLLAFLGIVIAHSKNVLVFLILKGRYYG